MKPGEIPTNARGASASRGFWLLPEKLREKYRAGWFDAYDRKRERAADFAYRLGYRESTTAHYPATAAVV